MCIFIFFPVGGVVVVAVGYTRACIHLWPVWSGHTCAIPNPWTSWHERRARAHACPYSHRAAPNPHTKIAVAKRNPAISITAVHTCQKTRPGVSLLSSCVQSPSRGLAFY